MVLASVRCPYLYTVPKHPAQPGLSPHCPSAACRIHVQEVLPLFSTLSVQRAIDILVGGADSMQYVTGRLSEKMNAPTFQTKGVRDLSCSPLSAWHESSTLADLAPAQTRRVPSSQPLAAPSPNYHLSLRLAVALYASPLHRRECCQRQLRAYCPHPATALLPPSQPRGPGDEHQTFFRLQARWVGDNK